MDFWQAVVQVVADGVEIDRIRRTWQLKNALLRWGTAGVSGLLSLVAFALIVLTVAGLYRQNARSAPVPKLKITNTPALIQRGEAIANSFCGGCHLQHGHLTGNIVLATHIAIPIGSFVASNLTPTGPLSHWTDGEIFRAIRNGIDADGNWLVIMSYTSSGKLSDDDTRAVIAYLRSQPAAGVPSRSPPDRLNLLGVIMLGAGLLSQGAPAFSGVIDAPPRRRRSNTENTSRRTRTAGNVMVPP
jgi:Cytochrome C oxidase, cbb3-type, subunit III